MVVDLMSAEWEQFAEKLRKNGYALIRAANGKLLVTEKGAADPNVIAATLLCRSLTHIQAVSILLKARLVVEARTIVRNCLENAFWLAALAEPDKCDDALRRMGDAEIRCLDVFPPPREGDEFAIQHGCQAVLSAMFAANDIWSAGKAVRLTALGDEYSALAGFGTDQRATGRARA